MYYILNYNELKLGDIILDRNDSRESQIIRKAINGDYSHARLYVGGTIMESEGLGVQSVNPQRILYTKQEDVVVMRHISTTTEQIARVCEFARSEFGKEYSAKDAKKRINKSVIEEPNREFCSRLVAQAYEYAGCPICNNAAFCNPENIHHSETLVIIPNMTHVASKEELNMATSDGYMKMEDDSNAQLLIWAGLLQNMRNVSGDKDCDIQNETQLIQYLLTHPHCDDAFTKILRESEYFVIWKHYEETHPWEFESELFAQKYGAQASLMARKILSSQSPIDCWERQYNLYYKLVERCHFNLFVAFLEMYKNILDWNNRRVSTMNIVAGLDL